MKRSLFIIALLSLFVSTVFAGRYYDPEIGRFTQIDPILQNTSPNELIKQGGGKLLSTSPYVYCYNNPLKYIDPDGNNPLDIVDVASFGYSAYTFYKEPSWENAGWLALDAIGLLPIIPAIGTLKYIDDAADLLKSTDRVKDISKNVTVLGKYPNYTDLASKIGANVFDIPTDIWNKMDDVEKWAANKKFLDRAISRGDEIILSDPVKNIEDVTGYFRRELDYLINQGYRLSDDGAKLIK